MPCLNVKNVHFPTPETLLSKGKECPFIKHIRRSTPFQVVVLFDTSAHFQSGQFDTLPDNRHHLFQLEVFVSLTDSQLQSELRNINTKNKHYHAFNRKQ